MKTRHRNNVEPERSTIVIESSTDDDDSSDMYKDNTSTTDDTSDWSDQDMGKMKAKAKAKKGKAKVGEKGKKRKSEGQGDSEGEGDSRENGESKGEGDSKGKGKEKDAGPAEIKLDDLEDVRDIFRACYPYDGRAPGTEREVACDNNAPEKTVGKSTKVITNQEFTINPHSIRYNRTANPDPYVGYPTEFDEVKMAAAVDDWVNKVLLPLGWEPSSIQRFLLRVLDDSDPTRDHHSNRDLQSLHTKYQFRTSTPSIVMAFADIVTFELSSQGIETGPARASTYFAWAKHTKFKAPLPSSSAPVSLAQVPKAKGAWTAEEYQSAKDHLVKISNLTGVSHDKILWELRYRIIKQGRSYTAKGSWELFLLPLFLKSGRVDPISPDFMYISSLWEKLAPNTPNVPRLPNLNNLIHIIKRVGEKHERAEADIFKYFSRTTPVKRGQGETTGEPEWCDLRALVLEYGYWMGGAVQSEAVPNAAVFHLYAAQNKPSRKEVFTGEIELLLAAYKRLRARGEIKKRLGNKTTVSAMDARLIFIEMHTGGNPCTRSVDSLKDLFRTRRADFEKAMAVDKWKDDDEHEGEAAEGSDDEQPPTKRQRQNRD